MEYVFHYLHLWLGMASQSCSQTHQGASMALGLSPWVVDALFVLLAWRGAKSLMAPRPVAPKPPTPKTFLTPDGTVMHQEHDKAGKPIPGRWFMVEQREPEPVVVLEEAPSKKQKPKIVLGGREYAGR